MTIETNPVRAAHIQMQALVMEIEEALGELADQLVTEYHVEGSADDPVVYLVLCERSTEWAVELAIPGSRIRSKATQNHVSTALWEIGLWPGGAGSGHSSSRVRALPRSAADVSVPYVRALLARHPLVG